jgi:hypothetical protein
VGPKSGGAAERSWLRAVASLAGLPAEAVERGVRDPAIKARLRALTDEAIARGVTGAPTVAVGNALSGATTASRPPRCARRPGLWASAGGAAAALTCRVSA